MTENVVIRNLCQDGEYFSNVFSVLEPKDFEEQIYKDIFTNIQVLYKKYSKSPSLDEIQLYYESIGLDDSKRARYIDKINEIKTDEQKINKDILIDFTESWLKISRFKREVAIPSIEILDGSSKISLQEIQQRSEVINKLTFKRSEGLNYILDAEKNFLEYSKVEEKGIKPNLKIVYDATGGIGYKPADLVLFLAASGAGKTLCLVNEAKCYLLEGKNVLYITQEEQEIDIRGRLDAAIMDKKTSELNDLGINLMSSFKHLIDGGLGNLMIKSYPPNGASALDYEVLCSDYKLKSGFEPDIIVHDSINITSPIDKKVDNLYQVGKAVAEELKALGHKLGCPVVSAIQANKNSYGNSSLSGEDISTSIGILQTASVVIGVSIDTQRSDIRILNMVKSRKTNVLNHQPVVVKVDTDKQQIWDMDSNKRTYIKKETKEQINTYTSMATIAEKVDNGEIDKDKVEHIEESGLLAEFMR